MLEVRNLGLLQDSRRIMFSTSLVFSLVPDCCVSFVILIIDGDALQRMHIELWASTYQHLYFFRTKQLQMEKKSAEGS